jgi:methyl-accepting chemotaxis protein
MDLTKASQSHAEWKIKLRMAIARKEQIDAMSLAADNCCQLGKWLHGEGKVSHGRATVFTVLVKRHAAFHKEAGAVAQAINQGLYDKATKMLDSGTPYALATSAVGAAILGLKKELAAA